MDTVSQRILQFFQPLGCLCTAQYIVKSTVLCTVQSLVKYTVLCKLQYSVKCIECRARNIPQGIGPSASHFGVCVQHSIHFSVQYTIQFIIQHSVYNNLQYNVQYSVHYNVGEAGRVLFLK